nr:cytochrome P450 [Moorena sp. SIO4E2]
MSKARNLVTKAIQANPFHKMHDPIQQITSQLVDELRDQQHVDLIADFAEKLPAQVTTKILGLPDEDYYLLQGWSKHLFHIFNPLASLKTCERLEAYVQQSTEYLSTIIAQRRKTPQSDLISALVTVEEGGEPLSEQEILSTCLMLITAGVMTTAAIIGNGILALLNHPAQLKLLREQPELLPTATEEIMRYDSPTQIIARTPIETLEVGGQTIHPGEDVIICLGAANRDPAEFTSPNQLDLRRKDNPHLAFATGSHFCLGAALARVEVPIAINTIVQQLPNLELTIDEPGYQEYLVLRHLRSLPVKICS